MTRLNPFEITFGKEPESIISRDNDIDLVRETFLSDRPDSQVFIITGQRGFGKTVSLTTLSNEFKSKKDWIVVEINPEDDILEQLAAKIIDEGKLRKLFLKAEFNFSFHDIGLVINGSNPINNISSLLKKEFEYLKSKNIKVLITIDEISSNKNVKIFAHEFQLFLRNNFDVFLLMTGLYQNVKALQNEKTLTFLKRAPKIVLNSLSFKSIVNSYKKLFDISDEESIKIAQLTKGYPFAYQLIGSILFKRQSTSITDEVIDEFDAVLQERAYSLIYEELTAKEQEILKTACVNNSNQYIIEKINIKKNQLSNYKNTLVEKGILEKESHTSLVFKLPRFKEFLVFIQSFEE